MKTVVFCEKTGDTALALIAQMRKIAPDSTIIALCEKGGARPELCGGSGADEAVLIDAYNDDCAQGTLIAQALQTLDADAALFPATIRGRFLSAWVAAKLDTGLTADCTDLRITENGLLKQVRPAFGGNLTAEILCKTSRPQMASVRPGVFPVPQAAEKAIPVTEYTAQGIIGKMTRVGFTATEGGTSLQSASVIVAGGKGIGGKRGFDKLFALAELLGGAVGATRSAVDAGWIAYEHQIGQTGITVRPHFYIAVGISGMVQHTVGMNGADVVLAINKDRNAPIFACADYGIIADWEETIDAMIKDIKERKAQK